MPKPYVHLVPPPLSVALDARMTGNETRFVRSGCRPNAVLRPVLCSSQQARNSHLNGEYAVAQENDDTGVLKFAIYALRDLKACEEVVLGWEWDDGAVVHQLPALIEEGSRAGPSKMTCVFPFVFSCLAVRVRKIPVTCRRLVSNKTCFSDLIISKDFVSKCKLLSSLLSRTLSHVLVGTQPVIAQFGLWKNFRMMNVLYLVSLVTIHIPMVTV